jgi:hypothetical protein
MEYVSGITAMVRKAGTASVTMSQRICKQEHEQA